MPWATRDLDVYKRQQQDDEIEAGIEHLHQLYNVMRNDKREPGKLSELKFGLECGGSDGLSGITRCV